MKNENGETILYVNQYYEKNLTTGEETTHYYLGSREIAFKNNDGLTYVHQDHLGSTVLTTDENGEKIADTSYEPYGEFSESPDGLDTDKLFTGQRLDDSGLYFYNARYYDATIGRFISADSIVPDPSNPQSLNRYSYCVNNPLKYVDPSGHAWWNPASWDWKGTKDMFLGYGDAVVETAKGIGQMASDPVGTAKGIGYAATHLGETWNAISSHYSTLAQTDRCRGQIVGEALITIATMGTAGAIAKSSKVAKISSTISRTASKLRVLGTEAGLLKPVSNGITVLGKYPTYVNKAVSLGANKFQIWSPLYRTLDKVGLAGKLNKRFLDLAVKQGHDILLSNSPVDDMSSFADELRYLKNRWKIKSEDLSVLD